MSAVLSSDGTKIAYSCLGSGSTVVLVDGALCFRSFGPSAALAQTLSSSFRVVTYDRRGRGESTFTGAPSVQAEVDDLNNLVAEVGARFVYGHSSGAALALLAADQTTTITKLAVYEPPYEIDPDDKWTTDYLLRLREALLLDRRGDAITLAFSGMGMTHTMIEEMRATTAWPTLVELAPSLEFDALIMGDNRVPQDLASRVAAETLVMTGSNSYEFMQAPARLLASTIPGGRYQLIEDETHQISPGRLCQILEDFFL